jgi:hypothetical protein
VDRRTLLWTLVAFFGASIAFNAINDLSEGEPTGVRIALQLLALAVIVGGITLLLRRKS